MKFSKKIVLAILLATGVVAAVVHQSVAEENDDASLKQKAQVVGDVTLSECVRRADNGRVVICLHHFRTKGTTHIDATHGAYIELNGKRHRGKRSGQVSTDSHTGCRSFVTEFTFDPTYDEIPDLATARRLRFIWEATFNGERQAVDETVEIVDIRAAVR